MVDTSILPSHSASAWALKPLSLKLQNTDSKLRSPYWLSLMAGEQGERQEINTLSLKRKPQRAGWEVGEGKFLVLDIIQVLLS